MNKRNAKNHRVTAKVVLISYTAAFICLLAAPVLTVSEPHRSISAHDSSQESEAAGEDEEDHLSALIAQYKSIIEAAKPSADAQQATTPDATMNNQPASVSEQDTLTQDENRSAEQTAKEIDTQLPPTEWKFEYPAITERELTLLAQLVKGEAENCGLTQKAAVIWVVFNRVDCGSGTIEEVVTGGAFYGWGDWQDATQANKDLALDVYIRWQAEKAGIPDVGRIIPNDCRHFSGDGKQNYFRVGGIKGYLWDFSLPTPYES